MIVWRLGILAGDLTWQAGFALVTFLFSLHCCVNHAHVRTLGLPYDCNVLPPLLFHVYCEDLAVTKGGWKMRLSCNQELSKGASDVWFVAWKCTCWSWLPSLKGCKVPLPRWRQCWQWWWLSLSFSLIPEKNVHVVDDVLEAWTLDLRRYSKIRAESFFFSSLHSLWALLNHYYLVYVWLCTLYHLTGFCTSSAIFVCQLCNKTPKALFPCYVLKKKCCFSWASSSNLMQA